MNKMKALKITGWVVVGITFFALTLYLVALILSSLWNWLMPDLFNLPEISLWQALGIFILSKLIFTPGFGHGKEDQSPRRKKDWKDKFKSRMSQHTGFSHRAQDEDSQAPPEVTVIQ